MTPVGVAIQQFGFIGKPRSTMAIEQAIAQKTQAITEAERARNQLAVTQAEMNKTVAEAEGEAKSAIERARGEAESAIQRARSEAEANRLRQAWITPQLMEWRRLTMRTRVPSESRSARFEYPPTPSPGKGFPPSERSPSRALRYRIAPSGVRTSSNRSNLSFDSGWLW